MFLHYQPNKIHHLETQPQEPVEVEAVDTAPVITPTQAGMAETQQVQIINATPVTPSTTPSPSSGAGGY